MRKMQCLSDNALLSLSQRESDIFYLVYHAGPATRKFLQKNLRLSSATVARITDKLLKKNLLATNSNRQKKDKGRKPLFFSIHPGAGVVLSLDLRAKNIWLGIVDLREQIIYKESLRTSLVGQSLLKNVIRFVKKVATEWNATHPSVPILGIAIGSPGLLKNNDLEISASHFQWESLPLKTIMEKSLGLRCFVVTNASARGQQAYLLKNGQYKNFIYLSIGRGVGATIFLNGEIYEGPDFSAGEVGHMAIGLNGPLCTCGNHGCLESFLRNKNGDISFNPSQRQEFKKSCFFLGKAVANLVNLFNPEVIIISGEVVKLGKVFFSEIEKAVHEYSLQIPGARVKILPDAAGEDASLIGTARYAINILASPAGIRVQT